MLGYELELCLADADGKPSKNNTQIIEAANNPLFTTELAKFNMEINGNPFPYRGDVFNRVEADLDMLYATGRGRGENASMPASRCSAYSRA